MPVMQNIFVVPCPNLHVINNSNMRQIQKQSTDNTVRALGISGTYVNCILTSSFFLWGIAKDKNRP